MYFWHVPYSYVGQIFSCLVLSFTNDYLAEITNKRDQNRLNVLISNVSEIIGFLSTLETSSFHG